LVGECGGGVRGRREDSDEQLDDDEEESKEARVARGRRGRLALGGRVRVKGLGEDRSAQAGEEVGDVGEVGWEMGKGL
jgi:hypothetical protein